MKLELIKAADVGEFEDNSEFHWDSALRGPEINPEVEEMASELYRCVDYDAAAAAFTLLTGSFPSYAEGFNYLGLINLDRGQLDEAIANFHLTVESGRKLFPKRMRKEHYWTDHSTRPYMRGLRNLALALDRRKSYQDAPAICDKLEDECNDNVTASCTAKNRDFFTDILSHSQVKKLLAEVSRCAIAHSELKDKAKHRANFSRWRELQSMEFAKIVVESMRAVRLHLKILLTASHPALLRSAGQIELVAFP